MYGTPKCFAPRTAPMSVFIPHVDIAFSFEMIAYQFETVFEIGTVDRIEAVRKTHQTNGHAYFACYVYFSKWGNGYYAQYLRNQLMTNAQTSMYIQPNLYWKVCNNTSMVHEENIPFPQHISLLMLSNTPNSLMNAMEAFAEMDIGHVNAKFSEYVDDVPLVATHAVTNAYLNMYDSENREEYQDAGFIQTMEHPREVAVIHLDFWNHSKAAYEFQRALETTGAMNYGGFGDETVRMVFVPYPEVATAGTHPYIWRAPSRDIKFVGASANPVGAILV